VKSAPKFIARLVITGTLFSASAFCFLKTIHAGSNPEAVRSEYNAQVHQTYDYHFGKDKPFLPSNATTEDGEFIQPGAFPSAKYCGHCHEAAYHQWRESLHSNSFRAPFYLRDVVLLNMTQGIEFSRHCEGCHNPTALFTGALTKHSIVKDRSFDNDGITCSVCHSIQKLQPTYGVGAYVMGVPAVMVDENGKPIPGEVPYKDILAHTDRHVQAVMKDFYRTPEYCGACHKANLPTSLNHYKWLRAIGLYDEWQASSFSHRSPLPFYSKEYKTCQDCHMPREAITRPDYGAKDKTLASHRWIGGNTAVPFFYGYEEQLQKTIAFLRDQKLNVDLFAIRKNNDPKYIAPLGSVDFDLKPNDTVETFVVIQNKGIGHTLIPEQRDIYQAWVQFTVKDATGRVLSESGYLQPDGTLEPRAHSFITRMLDKKGNLLIKHEVWLRHTNATDATIRPGRSTIVRYQFRVPADAKGPVTVTAKVNYRHLNQIYTNFILGDKHPLYPVVEMASRTLTFEIGHNSADKPDPSDNPDWMRWNNFGIALMDQQQYGDAVTAFEEVRKMRPDYADVYTNIGIAYLSWEKYALAGESIKKALELSPDNPRALYYQALVERNEGNLDHAIANLEKVVEKYPQSPDAHRELGFSYYQLHKYELAEKQYQALQAIDPDDLAAHYILAIVYRRLGMKEKASEESARFADEKEDPMANTASLQFLEKHPELSGESVPWHLHTALDAAPVTANGR
jgi:tetratricopeptide (TPR) repeat protein